MTIRLRRDEFRKWLERHAPHESVGQRRSTESCPIAQYLRRRDGDLWVAVGERTIEVKDEREINAPAWAVAFIAQVDDIRGYTIDQRSALRILDSIPRESRRAAA